ncbi:MAG: hypothetical protein HWN66_20635 [Candidatus Helarchaeota archaeon]|nr:hypothetical protein [Candidatus Helarchaeota archaeon]
MLGKEYLCSLGINFFSENPEYVEIRNLREKFIFLNSFEINPTAIDPNKFSKRIETTSLSPILSIEKKMITGDIYFTEIPDIIRKLSNIFCFRSFYKRDKDFENKNSVKDANYFEYPFTKEHAILDLIPQLFFRKKGYCILGGGATKLSDHDYGVDFIAYNSPTLDLLKKHKLVKNGFFLNELVLIRNSPHEFMNSPLTSFANNEAEIILFESEPSRQRVLALKHGIMQIVPKLKLGIANCGYVVYEGEKVTENEIKQRLTKDIMYKENMGIINIKPVEFIEPKTTIQINDDRIREYTEGRIRYYLLCNFTLNELLALAKPDNQIYTNISAVFNFLFDRQKLLTETIIEELIEVAKI